MLQTATSYTNVLGTPLQTCSSAGMARTGFMRDGYCTENQDDRGSHHICINLSSTEGGNFCDVTGQPDWCSSQMGCHEDYRGKQCPVEHWCVCQWAFASYIENAGGCGMIQDIVCDATNKKALEAYARENDNDERIGRALECIVERCGIGEVPSVTEHHLDEDTMHPELGRAEEGGNGGNNSPDIPILAGAGIVCAGMGLFAGVVIGRRMRMRGVGVGRREGNEVL